MSGHLIKSTASVGSMTLISRLLEFIRDMLITRLFGVDMATDAFFAAVKLPDFLRRLFAEGAFFNAALLFKKLRRDHVYLSATGWRLFMLRILVDSLRGNLMTDRHEAAKLI